MKIQLLLSLLFASLFMSGFAQDDNPCVHFEGKVIQRINSDPGQAYVYLDSMSAQGEECYWKSQYLRAVMCSRNSDSMEVGLKVIDGCIDHYISVGDTAMTLNSYYNKSTISQNLNRIILSIETLNAALELSYAHKNTRFIGFFEQEIGSVYLTYLKDTSNAFPHLQNALKTTVENELWPHAINSASELMSYYLMVGDIGKAEASVGQILDFASGLDSLSPERYFARTYVMDFYFRTGRPVEGIPHGMLAVRKGEAFEDDQLILWGSVGLSRLHLNLENFEKAYSVSGRAIEVAKKIGNQTGLKDAYEINWQACKALGYTQEALHGLVQYHELADENTMSEKLLSYARALFKGDLERKEMEKKRVELELEITEGQSRLQLTMIGGISFLLLIVLGYGIVLNRKNKEVKQINRVLNSSHEVVLRQKEKLESELENRKKEEDAHYFVQSALKVKYADIIMLESSRHYVLVHVAGRETPLLERISMTELVKDFPATLFVKAHRSYHVNLEHIVSRPSKYLLKMSNGASVNVSRSCVENLGDLFL